MEPTTLYYFYSTTAQVLAAISGLLAVFTFFKIAEVKELLIGDGMAALNRWEEKEDGYPPFEDNIKDFKRLRDAVGRKSIEEIKKVIKILAEYEIQKGRSLDAYPNGFQSLEIRYKKKIAQIDEIKSLTKDAIAFAFFSIVTSLISIILVEKLIYAFPMNWIIIIFIILVTFLSMLFTIQAIFLGLENPEDIEKKKESQQPVSKSRSL
ncbi:MAG TPA: hypothetical protein VK808_05540 [Bacteroidia bacterium]|jgi:hypothetical protein|nr:hypothetical protein [Bacteroidia bacterium]